MAHACGGELTAIRSASASAVRSGRATSTSVVACGSESARTLAAYSSRWSCSAASGPRQEVPEVLVSMNPVQAAGSASSRSVCPVGAVSKIRCS